MNKNELSNLCKSLGLAYTGTKATLKNRILNHHAQELDFEAPPNNFQFKTRDLNPQINCPIDIPKNSTAFEIFSKFFDEKYITLFANDINETMKVYPRREIEKLTVDKYLVYGYFALILETSFSQCKNLNEYHSVNLFFKFTGISQNVFLKMNTALWHISDYFFSKFEKHLNKCFTKFYSPKKDIAIDETVRRFKGKWGSKVYAPDKPAKFGIKYYCLVDKSGYLLWFKLHRSKKTLLICEEEEDNVTFNLCKQAIDHLLVKNPSGSFHLFVDNYYGSLKLAEYVLSKNWNLTFALRANRTETSSLLASIKKSITHTDTGPFNVVVNKAKTLAVGAWKDKGWFYFISSTHSNSIIMASRNKNGERLIEPVVEAAHYYTKVGMGAVDRLNQVLRSHDWHHKNMSWRGCHFQTIFRFILVNSWVIWKYYNGKVEYGIFVKMLRDEFIAQYEEGILLKQDEKMELRRKKKAFYKQAARKRQIQVRAQNP